MMEEKVTSDSLVGENWGGEMGEKWLANLEKFEGMIAPAGAALMARAGFSADERVVDIGCGGGATTIEIGQAVGPGGTVLGIDISPVLVDAARRRAAEAGVANVRFMNADAATVRPEGAPFDRLLSRFGSMFFEDFAAAFANYRALLRDGGRADLAVWAPARENGWIAGVQEIIRRHIEIAPPQPHAPGPFALDDPDFVRPLLEQAGFDAEFTSGGAISWSVARTPILPPRRTSSWRRCPSPMRSAIGRRRRSRCGPN